MPNLLEEIGEEGYNHCKNLHSILAQKLDRGKSNGTSLTLKINDSPRQLNEIPRLTTVTPWTPSSIPNAKPPLPEILDPVLERAAFTHSAVDPLHCYERLEWVGDIYLEMTATLLISSTFPNLSPGKCSQLRERLVKNETLAKFYQDYEFEKRANLPPEFRPGARRKANPKEGAKVMGDIFEAYCAAVVYSDPENGISRLATWLKALWAHVLSSEIQAIKPSDTNTKIESNGAGYLRSKEILHSKIVVPGVKLHYRDAAPEMKSQEITNHPLFSVGVYLDGWGEKGKLLGVGTAMGKKEAGNKAADAALANRELLGIYEKMKKANDVKRVAETGKTTTPSTSSFTER